MVAKTNAVSRKTMSIFLVFLFDTLFTQERGCRTLMDKSIQLYNIDEAVKPSAAAEAAFFHGIAQKSVTVNSRNYTVPCFFRDFSIEAYIFACEAKNVRARLPHAGYAPIDFPLGFALSALICLEHRDSDLGAYNEVALSVPLGALGGHVLPNWLNALSEFGQSRLHAHILHLPVTGELALQGGVDIFGYPKFSAGVQYRVENGARVTELFDDSRNFLSLRIRPDVGLPFNIGHRRVTMYSYPIKNGRTLRANFAMEFDDLEVRIMPHLGKLEFGNGEMAEAASLLLHRPLLHFRAERARGILHAPEEIQSGGFK